MSEIFISYARSTETQAKRITEALRALGYDVWRDDELPAHRAYSEVLEERLRAAKAVVVVWSADAAKSQWVRAEADVAREAGTLVQLKIDGSTPPLPFNQIQCADLSAWNGDAEAPGWRKLVASIEELARGGGSAAVAPPAASTPVLPLPDKPSIAVLPFANLSGDPEQEYFADGMVAEITGALSRFKSLFVIASSSALTLKGKGLGAQEAARQLGVRFVLEGSVRKAGNRVRIAVQLVEAQDGSQIWAERFDGSVDDIFELQDSVALAVAGTIEPTVLASEIRRASRRPTESISSYDLYLRAFPLGVTTEVSETMRALDLLHKAIDLDPAYGAALALAALLHSIMAVIGLPGEAEAHGRQAVALAQRALAVSADDAQILALCATALSRQGGDLSAALALAERSIELNPGSYYGWLHSGFLRVRVGEHELGLSRLDTALRLDPLSPLRPTTLTFRGTALLALRRYGEAAASLTEAAQLMPYAFRAWAFLASCRGYLGHGAAASEALARFKALTPRPLGDLIKDYYYRPEDQALFLEGIALAEGGG